MASNDASTHLKIYKAALHDDWDSVTQIFNQDPELMTKQVTRRRETPLILAVGTNKSHNFVRQLVERIVSVGASDQLFVTMYGKSNPLHHAAKVGNTTDARILVKQNPNMTGVANQYGYTPLILAAKHGHKDTLRYLLDVTVDHANLEEGGPSPYAGVAGADLINYTILAGFYDVAWEIIDKHRNIILEYDREKNTALHVLALKPEIFSSGNRFGPWGRLIYSLIPMKKSQRAGQINAPITTNHYFASVANKFTVGFWSILQYLVPAIKNIHDIKVKNIQGDLLVKRICKSVIENVDHDTAWKILGTSVAIAVKNGTHELIEECILTHPGIIWYHFEGFYLFLAAIKHRQERVHNLVYQMSGHKVFATTQLNGKKKENSLHIVAKLAPTSRLNIVTGAALQMQRELQWFKEVEKFIEPRDKEVPNKEGKTPRMIFTEEHKDLLKEGERWMKDTSSSCTVVAALIVTMAFAAAFTAPGGNKDDGKPLFIDNGSFMFFIISDTIALFSSSTSVLMFLGILTSRYAEDDFLYVLPRRITIGLLFLFVSLAATMIAFSATIALVLQDKVTWIAVPLVLITCIPVTLFVWLQFPLLVELVSSTCGPSIFQRQSDQLIH